MLVVPVQQKKVDLTYLTTMFNLCNTKKKKKVAEKQH